MPAEFVDLLPKVWVVGLFNEDLGFTLEKRFLLSVWAAGIGVGRWALYV